MERAPEAIGGIVQATTQASTRQVKPAGRTYSFYQCLFWKPATLRLPARHLNNRCRKPGAFRHPADHVARIVVFLPEPQLAFCPRRPAGQLGGPLQVAQTEKQ